MIFIDCTVGLASITQSKHQRFDKDLKMYITYCDKFVQIELAQGSRLLQKVLEYANKHFSKRYQLSSSLLILDDGERFKKDYLINWTYHATMQSVALAHSTTQAPKSPQKDSKATQKTDEISQNQTPQNDKKITKNKTNQTKTKEAKVKSTKKAKKSTQNENTQIKETQIEVSQKVQEAREAAQNPLADSIPSSSAKSDFADFATTDSIPSDSFDSTKSAQDALAKNTAMPSKNSTNPTNSTSPRHTDDAELAQILSYSHLPIRIKITNPNTLLKRIKVQIHLSNLGQILVRLPENNRVARRYIHALFGSNILYEVDNEFCISAVGYTESMWEGVMELISSRIIHNIALDFEFNSKKGDSYAGFGESGEGFETFLTREEYLLRKCYSELNVDFRDDFAKVKKQYLKLAKKFHPDNAQGKDKGTVEVFEERFKRILDAYNTIKASHAPHADKTTA